MQKFSLTITRGQIEHGSPFSKKTSWSKPWNYEDFDEFYITYRNHEEAEGIKVKKIDLIGPNVENDYTNKSFSLKFGCNIINGRYF